MTLKKILKTIAFITGITLLFLHQIDADGDFFQHINIGKHIVSTLTFPHFDNLTFTAYNREYIGYAWGAGVIFYFLYFNFGPLSINLLILTIALATFISLYKYLNLLLKQTFPNKPAANASIITLLIIAPLIATRFPTRPEIFQFPLTVAIFFIYEKSLKSIKTLYFLPLIIFLWANLYGSSAIFGIGIASTLFFFNLISSWQSKENFKKKAFNYIATLSLSIAAALINPYGLKSLFFIQYIPKMTELWGDWGGIIKIIQSPDFYGFPPHIVIICITTLALTIILVTIKHKEAIKHPQYLLFSLSLFVPFIAIRHRALAALISAPILAILVANLSEKSKKIVALLSIFIILVTIYMSPPNTGDNNIIFPKNMIAFIKSNNLSGRVFNTQQVGSFLEYQLHPQIKTFSDTRDELFIGTNALESITPILSSGTSLNLILRKYQINIVILSIFDGNSYKDILHDPKWSLVYFDKTYMIFIPTEIAHQKNLKKLEINN